MESPAYAQIILKLHRHLRAPGWGLPDSDASLQVGINSSDLLAD
jgi:hypothetical protein